MAKPKAKARKQPRGKRWTNDQVGILKRLFPTTPNDEVARQVHRPIQSVLHKAYRLGLRKKS